MSYLDCLKKDRTPLQKCSDDKNSIMAAYYRAVLDVRRMLTYTGLLNSKVGQQICTDMDMLRPQIQAEWENRRAAIIAAKQNENK